MYDLIETDEHLFEKDPTYVRTIFGKNLKFIKLLFDILEENTDSLLSED